MIPNKENSKHYFWGNNWDSWVLQDTENFSIKQEKMLPNSAETLHFHENAQQFFYILKGKATFYINEDKIEATAQNEISIKASQKHYIANEADKNLEILVISNPNTNNDRILV
jgi:mannose-6-phosphate isomerase-like protein (cupin superfamily)